MRPANVLTLRSPMGRLATMATAARRRILAREGRARGRTL
jgi:hypothetical protein